MRLAPKSRRYAKLAAQGFSNKEIAEQCQINIQTVKNSLHEACKTLGVTGRIGLARLDVEGRL
jgi:DNA-binding NarL/FixJ family response regulator